MRNMVLESLPPILLIAGITVAILLCSGWWRSQRLPGNSLAKFVSRSHESTLVVFVGDSITQGKIGASYTEMVSENLSNRNCEFVNNAGINGDVSWNVTQRLDEIIELQPDILTLMIGTNDAMGSLSLEDATLYRRLKGIMRILPLS